MKGRKYLDAMCVYFWATTPVLVSLLSFGTYILLGNQLTAAKVRATMRITNVNCICMPFNGKGLIVFFLHVFEGFYKHSSFQHVDKPIECPAMGSKWCCGSLGFCQED